MHSDLVLWIVIGTALAFDFTNGFHDTANAVAPAISTRAMPPKVAVSLAAILNFVGAFLSLSVAATIATGIVNPADVTTPIVLGGTRSAAVSHLSWPAEPRRSALPRAGPICSRGRDDASPR